MKKYKIYITRFGQNDWVAVLKKRCWFFGYYWRSDDAMTGQMPYTESVKVWQKKYKVPDERVYVITTTPELLNK